MRTLGGGGLSNIFMMYRKPMQGLTFFTQILYKPPLFKDLFKFLKIFKHFQDFLKYLNIYNIILYYSLYKIVYYSIIYYSIYK